MHKTVYVQIIIHMKSARIKLDFVHAIKSDVCYVYQYGPNRLSFNIIHKYSTENRIPADV